MCANRLTFICIPIFKNGGLRDVSKEYKMLMPLLAAPIAQISYVKITRLALSNDFQGKRRKLNNMITSVSLTNIKSF